MKHVAGCFGELVATLVLGAIGLGGYFLLKWGWSESPLITVVAVVVALGFMVFGVVAATGRRDFGTVGGIAAGTAVIAVSAAVVFLTNGQPIWGS